jgi:sialic acid synthase SpsE
MKTFVIAEAGANHDRNFDQAIKLINVAKEAGSTAVKFQTYSSETLYCKNTSDFAGYKNINKLIKDIELPREWQKDLKNYCDDQNIEFMSTPFDERAVEELVDIGVKRLKIAGFESTDFRFVEMVASARLPLIVSVGIGFRDEYLNKLLDICTKYTEDITLLHCNNAYPTPIDQSNINNIPRLIEFSAHKGAKVGFSDHTLSTLTPAFAVVKGATTIEKHFTLDKSLKGPDHPFALEPEELRQMVSNILEAEKSLINLPANKLSKSEESFQFARRSVVAKTKIKKGELLTEDNITTKRPYDPVLSIAASEFENVLGRTSARDYDQDEMI